MTSRISISLSCLVFAAAWATPVFAAAPPVKVEIVVEGEEDDFFEEEEAPAPVEAPPTASQPAPEGAAGVRQRADDAFDALQAEEDRHSPNPPTRTSLRTRRVPGGNVNNQVVNVVVVGDRDQQAKAEVTTTPAPPAPAVPPPTFTAPPAPPAPSPHSAHASAHSDWWARSTSLNEGDVMIFVLGGPAGTQGFGGLGLEGMATSQLGFRLVAQGTAFERSDLDGDGFGGSWDFHRAGRWGVPRDINASTAGAGFAHLLDLSAVYHMLGDSQIDLAPSVGLSHFGYGIDFDDENVMGGSGLLRLGATLGYRGRRFFGGVDLGWYPVEIFRYALHERPGAHDEFDANLVRIADRFVAERFTLSAHVGIRL